jgi:cell division protein FtsW (lipid II flippase)
VFSGGAVAVLGSLLLVTALFGVTVEGASRWMRVASLSLQPSLIVLPVMLVAFARGRDLLAAVGMVVAAAALALQPDRAMAGVLVAALAVLAMYRQERRVILTLAVAFLGFIVRPAQSYFLDKQGG